MKEELRKRLEERRRLEQMQEVEEPKDNLNVIKIPKQLQQEDFRFCLLRSKTKIPFEKNWTEGYKFNEEKLLNHNGNYGVIGGYGNLRIIDIDNEAKVEEFKEIFKDTLIVKTGSGKIHIYILSDYDTNHVFLNGLGEYRAKNYQVVGSGSIHPNGNKYEVLFNNQIKEYSEQEIKKILKPYLREEQNEIIETEHNGIDLDELISKGIKGEKIEGKKEDTSRSGLEYRKILALLREGKTREDIYRIMNAYSKWNSSPEQYRSLTFEKAENYYLLEQEKKTNNNSKEEKESRIELSKDILEEIKSVISKYIDTTPQNRDIMSLWILGTYFHKDFETFPLIQIYAQKRSGKTRTLKLLSSLSYGSDGSVSTSITETHLFRHQNGSLFFDEIESINSKDRGVFRETLNAVYKRGNKITRYKEVKKDYIEQNFYPFYPIGLANISGLNDVLGDRAIQIILKRSNKRLTQLVEDFQTNEEILSLKSKLSSLKGNIPKNFFRDWNNFVQGFQLENENLRELFEKIQNTGIFGRGLELFFPLIIISYLCDDVNYFLNIAKEFTSQKEENDSIDDVDERLKTYLQLKESFLKGFVNITDILKGFRESIESPEDWINTKWLGRALIRLGFVNKKRLVNGKTQIILNINSTLSTNTINTINTTNSTQKQVELVDYIDYNDLVGSGERKQKWVSEMKELGWSEEELEESLK